jgi:hypothetical protein
MKRRDLIRQIEKDAASSSAPVNGTIGIRVPRWEPASRSRATLRSKIPLLSTSMPSAKIHLDQRGSMSDGANSLLPVATLAHVASAGADWNSLGS